MNVEVQLAVQDSAVPETPAILLWIDTTFQAVPHHLSEITVRVVGKSEMRSLNSRFRGQGKSTNVLSFPSVRTPDIASGVSGDIAICAAVVRSEAAEQHKTLEAHWAHMTVHAGLHLCGYDHTNEVDAGIMETLEAEVLDKLGFTDPYTVS